MSMPMLWVQNCRKRLPFVLAINETIDEDSTIICSSGSLPGDLTVFGTQTSRIRTILNTDIPCMGYEISGALGIKLAEPEREVYSIVGDRSFLMLHSELITAIQYNKKINILLFDNAGFGCISNSRWTMAAAVIIANFLRQTIK